MIALKLDRVISQVCPIYGVSIGNSSDRLTWRFHSREEATPTQIQDASRAVESFVYSTVLTKEEKTEQANNLIDYKLAIKAMAQVTWFNVPAMKTAYPDYNQYEQAIVDRYKALLP